MTVDPAEWKKRWAVADRLSDGIVDLINGELAAMDVPDPLQILCGLLLGFKALEKSFPPGVPRPASLQVLQATVDETLREALKYGEEKARRGS